MHKQKTDNLQSMFYTLTPQVKNKNKIEKKNKKIMTWKNFQKLQKFIGQLFSIHTSHTLYDYHIDIEKKKVIFFSSESVLKMFAYKSDHYIPQHNKVKPFHHCH